MGMDESYFELPVSKEMMSAHRSAVRLAARLLFEALKERGHKVADLLEMSSSIADMRFEQMEKDLGLSLVVRVHKDHQISDQLIALMEEEPRVIPLLYYALSPTEGVTLRA